MVFSGYSLVSFLTLGSYLRNKFIVFTTYLLPSLKLLVGKYIFLVQTISLAFIFKFQYVFGSFLWMKLIYHHSLFAGLVFLVEKMGTILQLTMTLESMAMGPQLGVFTMGILMPGVDSTVR